MSQAIKHISSREGLAQSRGASKRSYASRSVPEEAASPYGDQQQDFLLSVQWKTRVRSLNQYLQEANDGISAVQVAMEALAETDGALGEMRRFTDTANPDYKLNPEGMVFWLRQVDDIAHKTEFNQRTLLDGNFKGVNYAVGGDVDHIIQISFRSSSPVALGFGREIEEVIESWKPQPGKKTGPIEKKRTMDVIDKAQESVAEIRAELSPLQERFAKAIDDLNRLAERTQEAHRRIDDVRTAEEVTALTKDTLLKQAKASLQIQANQHPQIAKRLLD